MKKNIRSKISDFLTSEEGQVGVKSPLVLGAASASLLLAQAMVSPSAQAYWECYSNDDCSEGEYCDIWCDGTLDLNTCIGTWRSHCISTDI
ncbi:hypothetical protein C6502_05505 [Candidatus Poribacteria bacterium]|nr:MAG: hypothetical protein C6502_05505 [Candidatus Poribacteria bacterium]